VLAHSFFQFRGDVIYHVPTGREEVRYCGDGCGASFNAQVYAGGNIGLRQLKESG
jgi:hypothetical protein